jgi:predicted RNA-binding protein YlqC (UPF0109 family)
MGDNREKRGKNGGQERHERRSLDSEQAGKNGGFIVWVMKEIAEIVNSIPAITLVEPEKFEPTGRDWYTGELIVSGWQRTDFYDQCHPLAYELGSRLGVDVVLKTRVMTDTLRARIETFVKRVAETFAGSAVEVTSKVFRRPTRDGDKDVLALAVDLKTADSDSKGRLIGSGGKNAKALSAVLRYLADGIGLKGGVEMDIEVKRESVPVSKSASGKLDPGGNVTAESTGSADPTPSSAGA